MADKKWTLEEWKKNCSVNCTNTYSMAVNFAALCIHEYGEDEGLKCVRGLSGAQAEYAIALSKKIPETLDKNKAFLTQSNDGTPAPLTNLDE